MMFCIDQCMDVALAGGDILGRTSTKFGMKGCCVMGTETITLRYGPVITAVAAR